MIQDNSPALAPRRRALRQMLREGGVPRVEELRNPWSFRCHYQAGSRNS